MQLPDVGDGASAVAFVTGDPVETAKTLREFAEIGLFKLTSEPSSAAALVSRSTAPSTPPGPDPRTMTS